MSLEAGENFFHGTESFISVVVVFEEGGNGLRLVVEVNTGGYDAGLVGDVRRKLIRDCTDIFGSEWEFVELHSITCLGNQVSGDDGEVRGRGEGSEYLLVDYGIDGIFASVSSSVIPEDFGEAGIGRYSS